MTDYLAQALAYAAHGLAVFPLKTRAKEPLTEHGVKDASRDEAVIREWWRRWPSANIGIATGSPSGVVVLDIDGEKGMVSLEALNLHLPGTPVASTGKGTHIYFRHPGDPVGNRVGMAPGLDLRADGGYVVAPPSVHPSGDVYEWAVNLSHPFAVIPEALLELTKQSETVEPILGVVQEGSRNDAAFRNAAAMRRRGLGEEAILAALLADNARFNPPLPERELQNIAKNAARYAPDKTEAWQQRQLDKQAKAEQPQEEPELPVTRASDLTSERVAWLWPGYIPLGKMTVLDGDPGLGKSMILLDLAARVSNGWAMPDGSLESKLAGPGGVIVHSVEDGQTDTIHPRLRAAKANLENVGLVNYIADPKGGERLLTIPGDVGLLRKLVLAYDARLVILDPLAAILDPGVDTHRDAEVRQALAPLTKMAQELQVAVIILRHLNKVAGAAAIYRGGGSIGIVGASRSGLVVAKHPDDPKRRVMAQTKSNLGEPAKSWGFQIQSQELPDGIVSARIGWTGEEKFSADALLTQEIGRPSPKRDRAAEFLTETLGEGPVESALIKQQAKDAEITPHTLREAYEQLGVEYVKAGVPPNQKTYWQLPEIGAGERGKAS